MSETHIIRTVKNRQNPYTMIARAPLNNPALSWEARGVLAYLLDKPDDWEVRFNDLVKKGAGGADRMRRILKELEGAGHVERHRVNDPRGRIAWETRVFETPITPTPDAPSTENRHMVISPPYAGLPSMAEPSMAKPSMAKPSTVNRHIYRDGVVPSTELNETERETAPPPSIADFVVTDELSLWAYQAAHKAGISPSRIDLETETEIWRDQIASGARDYPADQAADWRVWIHRAINYARTHPTKESRPDGTAQHLTRAPADPAAAARSAADLRAALGTLSAPGGPA